MFANGLRKVRDYLLRSHDRLAAVSSIDSCSTIKPTAAEEHPLFSVLREPVDHGIWPELTVNPWNRVPFGGRTNARVTFGQDVAADINSEQKPPTLCYTKTEPDTIVAHMEYDLLTKLRDAGHPVPAVRSFDGHVLKLEEITGRTLDDYIATLGCEYTVNNFCGQENALETLNEKLQSVLCKAIELAAKTDIAVNKLLDSVSKERLHSKQLTNIASQFQTSVETAARHRHTYLVMESLSISDSAFFETFSPLQDELYAGEDKYGFWTWGSYVRNIIVDNDLKLWAIDFNNPQWTTLQTSASYITDAYYPWRGTRGTDLAPTLFDESSRLQLSGYLGQMHNKHGGRVISDIEDFTRYLTSARVMRNIRQFHHAIDDASKTRDPRIVYEAMQQAILARYQVHYRFGDLEKILAVDLHQLRSTIDAQMMGLLQSKGEEVKYADVCRYLSYD